MNGVSRLNCASMLKTLPFLLALLVGQMHAQTPCDVFDHDGDNVVGANTWLHVLGDYGLEGGEPDVDGSGTVDVADVLAYIPHMGIQCPGTWLPMSSGYVLGVGLVEVAVHDNELAGLAGALPVGAVTYRLYAVLSEPSDRVLAMFGDDERPLELNTAGEFYGFGGVTGTTLLSDYQPLFDNFFPANAYSTWFSAGIELGWLDEWSMNTSMTQVTGDYDWAESQEPGQIALNDSIGGAFFGHDVMLGNWPEHSGLSLLGQFTVTDPSQFHGTVNLLVLTEDGTALEMAEGLAFDNDNLLVTGCTDESSYTFNPEATVANPEGCLYAGDYNGDGVFTVDDFLQLLSQYGCLGCPEGDLDADGAVTVSDLLVFLGLLGG